jgi:hypothetical protein
MTDSTAITSQSSWIVFVIIRGSTLSTTKSWGNATIDGTFGNDPVKGEAKAFTLRQDGAAKNASAKSAEVNFQRELAEFCSLRLRTQMLVLELSEVKEHRESALPAVYAEIATATDPWRSTFREVSETIERPPGGTEP